MTLLLQEEGEEVDEPEDGEDDISSNLSSSEGEVEDVSRIDQAVALWHCGNTMVADALAPCVARPSATMQLACMPEKVFVFHKETFQLPVLSEHWEMIENSNII